MADTAGATRKAILIVDDEEDILTALGAYLEVCFPQLQVLRASGGREALAVLGKENVVMIVTDFRMPEMNGLEFLQIAKGIVPDVPRVMMTAYTDMDLAIRALNENQVRAFLPKPVDPAKMRALVAEALG